mmetsp:Transcript_21065/g.49493  ORF Transcript_21065/g.49493 Transcript_21065/m.49493 type:complete len:302 (-) Transcript_21065:352-1257(-)
MLLIISCLARSASWLICSLFRVVSWCSWRALLCISSWRYACSCFSRRPSSRVAPTWCSFAVRFFSEWHAMTWFFITSTSSLKPVRDVFASIWSMRMRTSCRSVCWMDCSNFSLSASTSSWNCFRSFILSSLTFFRVILAAYSSPRRSSWESRLFIFLTDSSHCSIIFLRSSCSWRNSSAVLSISICLACVSVTRSSNSFRRLAFSTVSFSTVKVNSRTLESSARLYFSSVSSSSSFCLAAMAHCSSSSWFQFISSLNWSNFSLPRISSFENALIWSCVSSRTLCSRTISDFSRPSCRFVSA